MFLFYNGACASEFVYSMALLSTHKDIMGVENPPLVIFHSLYMKTKQKTSHTVLIRLYHTGLFSTLMVRS